VLLSSTFEQHIKSKAHENSVYSYIWNPNKNLVVCYPGGLYDPDEDVELDFVEEDVVEAKKNVTGERNSKQKKKMRNKFVPFYAADLISECDGEGK